MGAVGRGAKQPILVKIKEIHNRRSATLRITVLQKQNQAKYNVSYPSQKHLPFEVSVMFRLCYVFFLLYPLKVLLR